MAHFPVFIDLRGKKCTVIGGGRVGERKAGILAKFGGDITLVSPEVTSGLIELQSEASIKITQREFQDRDIEDAFIVIAATPDKELNNRIFRLCTAKGILVNVADCPEKCTFIFPSVVERGDLVIGITTSGRFPALSRKIRENIESAITIGFDEVVMLLGSYRKEAEVMIKDRPSKKEALKKMADASLKYIDKGSLNELKKELEKICEEYRDEEDNQGWDEGE